MTTDPFNPGLQEKLGAHEVAAWLRRHTTFLQQFPDLALTLVVPREDGPAASLASYQLEVLRDRTANSPSACMNCPGMRRKTSGWRCARTS